jgi:hypothetical protein
MRGSGLVIRAKGEWTSLTADLHVPVDSREQRLQLGREMLGIATGKGDMNMLPYAHRLLERREHFSRRECDGVVRGADRVRAPVGDDYQGVAVIRSR